MEERRGSCVGFQGVVLENSRPTGEWKGFFAEEGWRRLLAKVCADLSSPLPGHRQAFIPIKKSGAHSKALWLSASPRGQINHPQLNNTNVSVPVPHSADFNCAKTFLNFSTTKTSRGTNYCSSHSRILVGPP